MGATAKQRRGTVHLSPLPFIALEGHTWGGARRLRQRPPRRLRGRAGRRSRPRDQWHGPRAPRLPRGRSGPRRAWSRGIGGQILKLEDPGHRVWTHSAIFSSRLILGTAGGRTLCGRRGFNEPRRYWLSPFFWGRRFDSSGCWYADSCPPAWAGTPRCNPAASTRCGGRRPGQIRASFCWRIVRWIAWRPPGKLGNTRGLTPSLSARTIPHYGAQQCKTVRDFSF